MVTSPYKTRNQLRRRAQRSSHKIAASSGVFLADQVVERLAVDEHLGGGKGRPREHRGGNALESKARSEMEWGERQLGSTFPCLTRGQENGGREVPSRSSSCQPRLRMSLPLE